MKTKLYDLKDFQEFKQTDFQYFKIVILRGGAKAKLLLEAMFFIIIFTYLKQIYRSKMAKHSLAILDLYIYFRQIKMMMKNIASKSSLALVTFKVYVNINQATKVQLEEFCFFVASFHSSSQLFKYKGANINLCISISVIISEPPNYGDALAPPVPRHLR